MFLDENNLQVEGIENQMVASYRFNIEGCNFEEGQLLPASCLEAIMNVGSKPIVCTTIASAC